ncbi:Rhodanese-like domain-containing protein [Polychytrium aggregatum]|uniref:Rhodanese-like domain-containing protein n=1 Tax=Polychytrium aggregatum TaxID=110093 RepID=UPI0022FF163C|nr:Rhodanese-like domain-containing protein [Polychytrium aggregatum]KAI9207552.1 Rhodanese-like domain-containing protein [Polychytrium aggregatum]
MHEPLSTNPPLPSFEFCVPATPILKSSGKRSFIRSPDTFEAAEMHDLSVLSGLHSPLGALAQDLSANLSVDSRAEAVNGGELLKAFYNAQDSPSDTTFTVKSFSRTTSATFSTLDNSPLVPRGKRLAHAAFSLMGRDTDDEEESFQSRTTMQWSGRSKKALTGSSTAPPHTKRSHIPRPALHRPVMDFLSGNPMHMSSAFQRDPANPPQKIRRTQSDAVLGSNSYLGGRRLEDVSKIQSTYQAKLLPSEPGKDAIRRISPETVHRLLNGEFSDQVDSYHIIDCRFPYEYSGGHIETAQNVNSIVELGKMFYDWPENAENPPTESHKSKPVKSERTVIIFHCEFSSQRAPKMALYLRSFDRENNLHNYPHIHYPEIYILTGGYKAFYKAYKERCEPQNYVPMAASSFNKDCTAELSNRRKQFKKSYSDSYIL